MKKFLSLALALALLLSLAAVPTVFAADEGPARIAPEGETITIKVLNWAHALNSGNFGEQKLWQFMEEKTGVHLEFETYFSDAEEKVALKIASNDLPDVFYRINLTPADALKYADEEIIVPLTPYLETAAPNYLAAMSSIGGLKESLTLSDGNIYGFAYLLTGSAVQTSPRYYNQTWLDQLDMEMAYDLDGFYEILKAVAENDMNGNGDPTDEIPWMGQNIGEVLGTLQGSFGVANKGANVEVDLDADGNLRYYKASPEYRELLRYVHKLYSEGLIYQQIFDCDFATFCAINEQNRTFFAATAQSDYLGSWIGDFKGFTEPLTGYNGEKLWTAANNANGGYNTWITADNPYVEETIKYFDHFYGDEGMRLYFMGFEGETWEYDENGKVQYTEFVTKNPDGLNSEEVLAPYVVWSGGRNPSIAEDLYWGLALNPQDTEVDAALLRYRVEEVWPEFSYSAEDSARMTTLQVDIETYVDDMTAKFISGNVDIETEWDTYLATLERMGLPELMEIYGRGYDAYLALK